MGHLVSAALYVAQQELIQNAEDIVLIYKDPQYNRNLYLNAAMESPKLLHNPMKDPRPYRKTPFSMVMICEPVLI